MEFVWDESKNETNKKKQQISFEDARNVFADPLAVTRVDRKESEPRWQIMGHWGVLIVAVYAMVQTEEEEQIRIISARKASTAERRQYEEGKWF